jgi:hypothetical protein
MMTMQMLTFVIATFCEFKNPQVPRDYKEACMEHMVNCAIVEDGKTSNELVDKCRERWIESNGKKSAR